MATLTHRRSFLRGLVAAPAVVAASSIMPVRSIARLLEPWPPEGMIYLAPGSEVLITGVSPWLNGDFVQYVYRDSRWNLLSTFSIDPNRGVEPEAPTVRLQNSGEHPIYLSHTLADLRATGPHR